MPLLEEYTTKATERMTMAFDSWQIDHRSSQSVNEEDGLQAYRMESYGPQAIKTPAFCNAPELPDPSAHNYFAGITTDSLAAENRLSNLPALVLHLQPTLPDIQTTEDNDSGVIEVGKDLAIGAIDELTSHPGRVLASAAIGLGVGIGATFVSPVVIGAGLVVAGGYGLYTLSNKVPTWLDAAKVVSNPNDYSLERKMQAHSVLQDVGAGTVTLVASAIGAVGTAPATAAIKSVFPSMAKSAGHHAGSTFGAAIFDDVVVPIVATRGKDGI